MRTGRGRVAYSHRLEERLQPRLVTDLDEHLTAARGAGACGLPDRVWGWVAAIVGGGGGH
jgi:hypothetical protein